MLAEERTDVSCTHGAFDDARFAALLDEIKSRRDEFDQQRHVSDDVIKALQELGFYRAFVPEQFGGSGMHGADFLRLIERISEIDGSTGWVASFAFATKYLSALPPSTLATIYAESPDVVFAGAIYPPQPAKKVDGGYKVSGRWTFGSGCMGASLLGVGISVEGESGGLPLMAVMPAKQVTIEQTWDTIGMAGTGSHDLIADNVFVGDDWVLERGAGPTMDTTAYRYPTLAMSSQVLAVCGLGVARGALDYVISIADKSKSITGAPTLGDRSNVQIHLAEAEAKLRSARAWFYELTRKAWDATVAGHEFTHHDRMELRLAASHGARTGAEVTRACVEMTGTIGIFRGNPLSRHMTDAMVTAQHAFLTEGSFMNAGKMMVGHPPIPGYT
jgi:indole-3-acetate monooxygenase